MKKKTIIILFVLFAVAATAFWYFRSHEKIQDVNFATAKAQHGYIGKSVTATGTIEPVDTVSVGAQVSGVVKKVLVDFNSVVKKGELLAEVDPSVLMAQSDESRANLVSAKSNQQYEQSTYERQNQLFNLGAISKADYQVALNQYNNAKAAVDNAEAQLRVTTKTLSYTNIYSPVDGVVLNRNVSAGQTIASSFNAPVLFVIAKDLTKMEVNADVDEADIGGVQAGQNATFTVDAFPNDLFKGIVQDIQLHPSVSANVVTYKTLINVDNAAMKLKPGMTASVNIYTEEDNNALLIPSRALNFRPDSSLSKRYKIIYTKNNNQRRYTNKGKGDNQEIHQSSIWIKSGDTLTEKRIITGLADDVNVKVLSGLSPTEDVITNEVMSANKIKADNSLKSPFTQQMQRRPAPGKGN